MEDGPAGRRGDDGVTASCVCAIARARSALTRCTRHSLTRPCEVATDFGLQAWVFRAGYRVVAKRHTASLAAEPRRAAERVTASPGHHQVKEDMGEPMVRRPSEPFLTEAQREALDAALAAKQKANSAKSLKAYVKDSAAAAAPRDGRDSLHAGRGGKEGDRKSKMGKGSGRPKKGGSGGKYVWGGVMDEEPDGSAIDYNDPNYDSEEDLVVLDAASATTLGNFKNAVWGIVEEYFNSGDIPEASRCLSELCLPQYAHWFVKHLIRTAMGRKDREREMTSVLLSSLYGDPLGADQVVKGFENLVDSLEDLVLDVPSAAQLLALFISRTIVDDVLPPSFLSHISAEASEQSAEVRRSCESHLGARHAAEALLRCWGSGAGLMLDETKSSIKSLLAEYKESSDIDEARRCIISLGVPFYLHELVKQAVTMGLEKEGHVPAVLNLLKELSSSGELSQTQLSKGLQRCIDSLGDLELDCPNARQTLSDLIAAGHAAGWLDKQLVAFGTRAPSEVSSCGNSQHVPAFKSKVAVILKEYLHSADAKEVQQSLQELQEPGLMHIFVKKAITMALDGKHKDREEVSVLLSSLYPDTIKPEQMAMGLTKLLVGAEDLALDVPEASHMLSLFLGRLIVDDSLPPSFLTSVLPSLEDNSLGVSIVRATGSILAARHGAERLQNCWKGAARDTESVRGAMRALLEEYKSSKDAGEAARCLAELATPHYHHEFVKQVLLMGMVDKELAPDLIKLLQQLCTTGQVSETQVSKGFDRVEAQLDDIVLDIPSAKDVYSLYKQEAVKSGWMALTAQA
eukprot:jgi/Tetstr1/457527/TSEL_044107.t1